MDNYKLKIAYDGSQFSGWQRLSDDKNTLQNIIEKSLERLIGEKIKIIGSGRTDKGVHAYGQVANFYTKKKLNLQELMVQLKTILPLGISIISIEKVIKDFHSRYDAKSKTYRYLIKDGAKWLPDDDLYCYRLDESLNLEAMNQACELLVGKKDFRAFTTMKDLTKSCVRHITLIDISRNSEGLVIEIAGNGFLYNMVRIMVGTLIEIGQGRREIDSINTCLKNGVRAEAGYLVPPNGLYLIKVDY